MINLIAVSNFIKADGEPMRVEIEGFVDADTVPSEAANLVVKATREATESLVDELTSKGYTVRYMTRTEVDDFLASETEVFVEKNLIGD